MRSKPRGMKIWAVLQLSLTILSLITLRHLSLRPAPTTSYSPIGADLMWFFISWAPVVGFILGIAIPLGLWAGKGWARNLGTVYLIASLLYGLFLIYVTVPRMHTTSFVDGLLIIGIVYVLVSLPNFYLATRPRVQDFFKPSVVLPPFMKCPHCGTKYRGHGYCPVCKVKLEPIVKP